MKREQLTILIRQLMTHDLSPEEQASLKDFINHPENRELFIDVADELNNNDAGVIPYNEESWKPIISQVMLIDKPAKPGRSYEASFKSVHRIHFLRTAWFRYAAAILLLFGSVVYFRSTNKKPAQTLANGNKSLQADIESGNNKAILTLADGSTIVLDNAANGKLAQQGNAAIVKLSNGEIAYNFKGVAEGEVMMNTMSTPRGGQYQLVLPDGSKIWLNAASSITYPAVFVGKERKIKITGEAYLEVAKNKAKPFIVDVDGKSLIEVLGTSFNVNSYANEATIKTTLVEGSVKVKAGNKESLLKPGQRAEVIQNDNTVKVIDNVNIDQTLAWKNGVFNLQNLSLQEFARQLERWYDIEIKYEGNVPDKSFEGKFRRDVKLSDILNWFSELGIQNRLEGRTLILSAN